MDGFNIGKILFNLQHPELLFKKQKVEQTESQTGTQGTFSNIANNAKTGGWSTKQATYNTTNYDINIADRQLQQLNFQGSEKSAFIRNILGLPQNMGQILLMAQNLKNPLIGGTLGLINLNRQMLPPNPVLSTLFEEGNITKPVSTQEEITQATLDSQKTAQTQQNNVFLFSGMISMPEISKLILQNSKQAVAALIVAMASASRQGVGGDQLRDMLGIINSCVAMAESDNPATTLKSLMMLYIPWLPLNDGVGFDLEISEQSGENDSNDSKLTVLIQTKNYGNVKGVFTLTTTNSVDAYIICTDTFPKKELQDYLSKESNSHAMNTNIDIEEIKPQEDEKNETQETKVNLSATNEMNPYLLLIAHAFIRGTIAIDNNQTVS